MAPHHGVANQLVTCINQVPLGRLLFEQRCRQLDGSDKSQPDREAYFHAITDAVHGTVVSSTILASTQAARKRQSRKFCRLPGASHRAWTCGWDRNPLPTSRGGQIISGSTTSSRSPWWRWRQPEPAAASYPGFPGAAASGRACGCHFRYRPASNTRILNWSTPWRKLPLPQDV